MDSYWMGYWKVGLVEGGGSLRTLEGYILSPEPTHSLPGYQEVSNLPQLFLCVMMFLACYRPEHDAASQPWTTAWSKMNLCFLISLGLAMKVWQNTGSDSIASLLRDVQLARVQVTIWWWAMNQPWGWNSGMGDGNPAAALILGHHHAHRRLPN